MSQYEDEGFAHLEGASAYSFNDTASAHSTSTHHQLPPHLAHEHDEQEHIAQVNHMELNFDQLDINSFDGGQQQQQQQLAGEQLSLEAAHGDQVANLYDEDFDGMLDDLNRELPPHACR